MAVLAGGACRSVVASADAVLALLLVMRLATGPAGRWENPIYAVAVTALSASLLAGAGAAVHRDATRCWWLQSLAVAAFVVRELTVAWCIS